MDSKTERFIKCLEDNDAKEIANIIKTFGECSHVCEFENIVNVLTELIRMTIAFDVFDTCEGHFEDGESIEEGKNG